MEPYQRVSHANGSLYNCPYDGCSYKTQHQQSWIQHKHQHKIREEKRFACNECSYLAPNGGQLRDHINTVHLNVRVHKCPKCDYTAGFKSQLQMHLRRPHLVCEHCSTFVTVSKLKMGKHVKNVHARLFFGDSLKEPKGAKSAVPVELPIVKAFEEEKPRKTEDSNEIILAFSSLEEAREHGLGLGSCFRAKTSKADTYWRYICREVRCPAKWRIAKKNYTDGSCGYALTANLRHNHVVDGDVQGQVKVEVQGQDKKHFSCDFKGCSFKTDTIKELRDHKGSHKPWYLNRKFKCKWCDHTTVCQTYLTNHVNAIHLNFKPYKCDQCDYANSAAQGLRDHIQKKHGSGEEGSQKKYGCDQCDFTTKIRFELPRHTEQFHRGISRESTTKGAFKCDHCGFESMDRGKVVDHFVESHPEVPTDKCNLCDYVTIGRYTLINHMRKHNRKIVITKCDQCDFESASQTDVAVHKKDVHGVPYEFMCEFCGKEFIQIKSLRNHKAKCTSNPDGEEVQEKAKSVHMTQCDLCEYACKFGPAGIKKHFSSVHDDADVSLKCQLCDFAADELRAIERHVKDHGVALTTCRDCGFTAHHGPIMLAHFESVHETRCRLCSHEAKNSTGLRQHKNHAHGRRGPRDMRGEVESTAFCDRCGFAALDSFELRSHIIEKHDGI